MVGSLRITPAAHTSRTQRLQPATWGLLLVILLLAAALRFYRLDLVEYKLDEANLSRMALDITAGKGIPLHGIGSSVGLPNGPLSVWLLAIPYAFSRSPLVATGFVAALNVLAVAMSLALTWKMFGRWTAWVTALLFAVAPWAVLNSRKLWAQDLLPPFVVGYLWTAYLAFIANKPWAFVAHILTLSACIQLHYSALTLVPLTLTWIVVLWWKRWPWKVIATALVIGLASIAPFALQIVRSGANVSTQLAAIARPATGQLKMDADAVRFAWLMTTGMDLHSLAGPDEFRNFLASSLNVSTFFHLEGILATGGLLLGLWRFARRRSSDKERDEASAGFIVATLLLFPVALFTLHTTPVYPHYFILTFPSQFMLAGMLVQTLVTRYIAASHDRGLTGLIQRGNMVQSLTSGRVVYLGVPIVLVVIVAAQVYAFLAIQTFVGSRATPGGYGTPVGMMLRVVHTAEQLSRTMGNVEIIVQGSSDNVLAEGEAAVFDVLLDPRLPRRFVNMSSASLYPANPAVFVQRVLPSMSVPSEFALRPGEGGYSLSEWNGLSDGKKLIEDRLYQQIPAPTVFVSGAELLGYRVSGEIGHELRFSLAWQVKSAPAENVDYHWTSQLFDAEGTRVWQKDDVGFPASSWRAGDLILANFAAPLDAQVKPGVYQMHVGMYTYPDIKTVPTTDWQAYAKVGPIEIK